MAILRVRESPKCPELAAPRSMPKTPTTELSYRATRPNPSGIRIERLLLGRFDVGDYRGFPGVEHKISSRLFARQLLHSRLCIREALCKFDPEHCSVFILFEDIKSEFRQLSTSGKRGTRPVLKECGTERCSRLWSDPQRLHCLAFNVSTPHAMKLSPQTIPKSSARLFLPAVDPCK